MPVLAPELAPSSGERLSLDVSADPTLVAIGLQFRTIRGSGAAVQGDGHRLLDIRKNKFDTEALIRFELARILGPLEEAGTIEVLDMAITAGEAAGNRGRATVKVKLLRTGEVASLRA